MGRYLNPADKTKESWLVKHGRVIDGIPPKYKMEDHTVAILVQNNGFTACALCTDQHELETFNQPNDLRPKLWFWIPDEFTKEFM